ncbi:MAG: ABC transporter ATP-binding protein [Chloroflexi bacterium]|nr:ABC transporter ATP-binding protein [Chloroflexota bacterium]
MNINVNVDHPALHTQDDRLVPAVKINALVKDYPSPEGRTVRALDLPALTLPLGGEIAIAGPSGSGKTTLLNIIAGLLLPSRGDVRVLGKPISQMSEAQRDRARARNIGYVFQASNLLSGFSALENVLLSMTFAGNMPVSQQRERARNLLERVGLADRLNHRPAQLSSGQQQRVALARALANSPKLLLADEPTAHVDFATGRQIVELLRSICAENGAALLLVSHDRDLLATFQHVVTLQPAHVTDHSPV